ncbi:MAG: hypothetical protein RIR11_3017 [Bacteroidota bacterium]|jgi:hypothetical protein
MTHFKNSFTFLVLAGTLLFANSCKKDDKTAEENITTIEVHITGAGFDKKFFWNDTDGDGVANSIDSIVIPPNVSNLKGHLHVYDRTVTPEIDLTEEIEGENKEHLFVYNVNLGSLVIKDLNTDDDGKPFGITSVWATQAAGTGTVNIKLYHEPTDKNNAANPGGDVDFDVTFPVVIR